LIGPFQAQIVVLAPGRKGLDETGLASLPLAFSQNNGQWDNRALFRADGGLATVWITTEAYITNFRGAFPEMKDQ